MEEDIVFREIPGLPGYRAGSDGSVWSCRRRGKQTGKVNLWKELKQVYRKKDKRFCVTINGKATYTHLLILSAFAGPCPEGMEGCHNNGKALDNRPGNLRWGTRKSNIADKKNHGTNPVGEKNPRAKLNPDIVRAMRAEHAGGASCSVLAKKYKVAPSNAWFVVSRTTWKHVE